MEKYDSIIIGAGPAGLVAASRIKNLYQKKVLIIKNVEKGVVPCGIPYMFKTLSKPEDNFLGTECAEKTGVIALTANVTKINKEEKIVITDKGEFQYDKLVIATGADAFKPNIPGSDKFGVYTIKKEMFHLKNLKEDIEKSKKITIIGGGFIGVEFAEEISKYEDKEITIIEFLPHILSTFDKEISEHVENELKNSNITIKTNSKLEEILGDERVSKIKLSNGEILDTDLLIISIGTVPRTKLAEDAELKVNRNGIKVDAFMKTSDENIFAIGDCAEKHDFFTNKSVKIGLASVASTEARIAAHNLYENKIKNQGVITVYSTKIKNTVYSSAGLTENLAKRNNIEYVIGISETIDRHPGTMPNTAKITTKLLFNKRTRKLIGAQLMSSDGEIINQMGIAIEKGTTVDELIFMQIATHPKITAPPTMYPTVLAAEDALNKF